MQAAVKRFLAYRAGDSFLGLGYHSLMARPKRPPSESRLRLHFINEWADKRQMSQAEIADSLQVDPSTVSRWFEGGLPSEAMLPRIVAMFGIELDELFRMPGDDWLLRFFHKRNKEEKQRIKDALEKLFPDKIA